MALSGFGLLLAAIAGILSIFSGVPFLTGLWVYPRFFGVEVALSTPMLLFDIGVYFVVFGAITSTALALEERERD
jgi:multicomponent Na+:H+ antiporter subunit B